MKLKRSPDIPSSTIDAVMHGYVIWREESAAVESAYANWLHAEPEERELAFAAYSAALDREECAAVEYRELIERATTGGLMAPIPER